MRNCNTALRASSQRLYTAHEPAQSTPPEPQSTRFQPLPTNPAPTHGTVLADPIAQVIGNTRKDRHALTINTSETDLGDHTRARRDRRAGSVRRMAGRPVGSCDPTPTSKPLELARAAAARPAPTNWVVRPNPDEQYPAPAPTTIVRVITPAGGFDWGDAGIGAAAGVALSMIGLGGALAVSQRRTRRSRRSAAVTS